MIAHAGLVALRDSGGWRGALIQGTSGAGKSDLALRCLDEGFRLVADDRVLIWACGGELYGRAPETLLGRMEARGLGVLAEPALGFCRIVLSVQCGAPERLPEPSLGEFHELKLPQMTLAALESSAPAKLRRAMQHLGRGAEGAYQDALAVGVAPRPGGDSR